MPMVKYSVRFKIIVLVLAMLLPLGGYTWYHYNEMIEHDTRDARLATSDVVADGARMLDRLVEHTSSALNDLARHPSVAGLDDVAIRKLVVGLKEKEAHLLNIVVVDARGRLRASAIEGAGMRREGFRQTQWFRKALQGAFVGGYHLSPILNAPTVMIAVPIRTADGAIVGVVGGPLDLGEITRLLRDRLVFFKSAVLHVVDQEGNMLIDIEGDGESEHVDHRRMISAAARPAEESVVVNSNEAEYLVTALPVTSVRWTVVMGIPLSTVLKDARGFGRHFLVIYLALLAVGLALGLLFAGRIGRRIREITDGMQEMGQGNLAVRLTPVGGDELQVIADQFNAMADARGSAEAALRNAVETVSAEKARTEEILESISDAISIQDRDFRILYQNAAQKQFFGDRTGEFCFQAYERNDRVCDGCGIHRCFQDGKSHTVVRSVEIEGRGTVYAEITSSPLRDASGKIVAGIEVARDITARKRLEEELHLKDFAIRSAVTAIAFVGLDEKIRYANDAFCRMFGIERGEDVVGSQAAFFGENEDTYAQLRQALLNDGHWIGERRARRRDGVLLDVFISAHVVRNADGAPTVVMASLIDITEKKEQDARLAVSERLAALGKMASGIAHEINNPLAAIAGCAEGLLNRIDRKQMDPEFFRNYLAIIQEEVFRSKTITSSMLSMVRESSFERKVFDINETVRKAVDVIGYQGRLRNITVEMDLLPGDLAITGSEGEIRQVVLAIMSNAIDAMEEMGTIRIASGKENGACFIAIADDGPGIPPEQQGRIFDPFFTTKMHRGGTGLGLSIADRIISNHGGSIAVLSSEGKGATFKLRFPPADRLLTAPEAFAADMAERN